MKATLLAIAAGAAFILLTQMIPVANLLNACCGLWFVAGGMAASWVWSRMAGRRSLPMSVSVAAAAGLLAAAIDTLTGVVTLLFAPAILLELPPARAVLAAVPVERPLTYPALLARLEALHPPGSWLHQPAADVLAALRAGLAKADPPRRARYEAALAGFAEIVDAARRKDLRPLVLPFLLLGAALGLAGAVFPAGGGLLGWLVFPHPGPAPEHGAPAAAGA